MQSELYEMWHGRALIDTYHYTKFSTVLFHRIHSLVCLRCTYKALIHDNTSSGSCSSTCSVQPDNGLLEDLRIAVESNCALRARADTSEAKVNALMKRVEESGK